MREGLPLVAIIGRPNVGKSTLFNRLVHERRAIVEGTPGVTRDRLYAKADWNGKEFILVDTGGITETRDTLSKQVSEQSILAAAEADLVLLVVDAREGLLSVDRSVMDQLRRVGKPILLAANKAEHIKEAEADFFELGLGRAWPISAEHGLGIGDLLDELVAALPEGNQDTDEKTTAVAVVGRPNAGKSTLVNALLGEERMITDEAPGTTRDAVDTHCLYGGRPVTLIDTAGIRRSARVQGSVEYYSVLRAIKAVERSEVVLLVITADSPSTVQDQRIAGIVREAGKACLILVNKSDLLKDMGRKELEQKVRASFDFLDYAPLEFISARTGSGVRKIMPLVLEIADECRRRISTARLNEVIDEAVMMHEPPSYKGRKLRLYYAVQVSTGPPIIQIHVNDRKLLHFSYERFLQNRLREAFGFRGTPIVLRFKDRPRRGERSNPSSS